MVGIEDNPSFLKLILILLEIEIGIELHHFDSQMFLVRCQLPSRSVAGSGRKSFSE